MLRVEDFVRYHVASCLFGGVIIGMTNDQWRELEAILKKNETDSVCECNKYVKEESARRTNNKLFYKVYTDEQESFLRNSLAGYEGVSYKELTQQFNERFLTNKSVSAIKTKYLRLRKKGD